MSLVTTTYSDGDLFDGRYRLDGGPLGAGTSGEVWRAEDTYRSQVVALKILINTDEDDAWQEARRLTTLESPNILRVNNADVAIDVPYIDSVLAEGGTAADEMEPFGMSPARAVHLTRGALRGLQLCHDRGILHRDVKPANIFISATGDAQLGDFGCAGLMAADGTAKPKGDPDIRPLDVLKGAPSTTNSDVYGAGLSMYAMLTGALPFSIKAAGDFKAHRDSVAAGMNDIREAAPHISIGLAKVVRKATAAKAADRYSTAADFSAALARLPTVAADISRVAAEDAPDLDHRGHARCWRVVRRSDGEVTHVCEAVVGRTHEVEVLRATGRRRRPLCKNGLGRSACSVHLKRVFNELR